MKNYVNYIVLGFCLMMSVNLLAQVRKTKTVSSKNTKVFYQAGRKSAIVLPTRKIMHRSDKLVWVYATNTSKGNWQRAQAKDNELFTELRKSGDSLYRTNFSNDFRVPRIAFEPDRFEQHPEWLTKNGSLVKSDGSSRIELKGATGKTNIYYHKNINLLLMSFAGYNKYGLPETNRANTNHIIVTDTLIIPPHSMGFMNVQRRNKGYVKIIANCIIYERPVKVTSTMISEKTNFVISARKILLKSPYKDLTDKALNTAPFVWKVDPSNVEFYKEAFKDIEELLFNRLLIEYLKLVTINLQNPANDSWSKDRLLAKFQTYRGRVNFNELNNDSEYYSLFTDLCKEFDTKYGNGKIGPHRTINDLDILVEGNIQDLPVVPFKYYAVPSTATLLPVKNHATGVQDKLGDLYYKATGESKMSVTLEVKLGYDAIKIAEVKKALKEKGFVLENIPPKTVMAINEQPLKAKGRTIGEIIPISNQILRFEIDLPDEGLDIIKLFLKDDNIFDLDYKVYQGQKESNQKIMLTIPENILKQIDFADLLNEFNTIESNTMTVTDAVIITSNLSPVLEGSGEGTLEYIEVSLEFLFDDKTVFRGPERFSSHSVNGSEKEIPFMKHSDNYKIIVTGTAYYEFGNREIIKENSFTNTDKYITLQESMFNKN
ncbi:hypothetical protein FF125_05755 [Aureibaculum algae]|uniref:Uncharacterized protein n=1 Tax=Aureibaculum algae TaxID=2584122 RepID=A0A5B7TR89_9FLAO|nr:hypothetical protein [Aureibaculum algae]QCX37961.1 hypothetical protein FF125_05755 [Aureibaculum algae]